MDFTLELLTRVLLGYGAAMIDVALVAAVAFTVKSAFRERRLSQPVQRAAS